MAPSCCCLRLPFFFLKWWTCLTAEDRPCKAFVVEVLFCSCFVVSAVKGGVVASLVQHHLQQRLLSVQTGGGFGRCQPGFFETPSSLGTLGAAAISAAGALGPSRSSHPAVQQAQQVMSKLAPHRQLSSPTGTSRLGSGGGAGSCGGGGDSGSSTAASRGPSGKQQDQQHRPGGSGVPFDQGGSVEVGRACVGGVTGTKPSTKTLCTRWGDPLDAGRSDRGRASGIQRRK